MLQLELQLMNRSPSLLSLDPSPIKRDLNIGAIASDLIDGSLNVRLEDGF